MPRLFTVPAGLPIAEHAAAHILAALSPSERPQAVIFVPTRRAVVTMRAAFQRLLQNEASVLPRILPLAEIEHAILMLLGSRALPLLEAIPPAMPEWQRRYLLTAQIQAFLKRQQGIATLDYALALAKELMALQEQCARSGIALTPEKLRGLVAANMAEHWEQAAMFLGILAEHWPNVEAELGQTIAPAREVRLLTALARAWSHTPPEMPVFVVGSTASQESTSQLVQAIAHSPRGGVILPGLDPAMPVDEWSAIAAGHPLYYLKQFLDRLGMQPNEVEALGTPVHRLWRDVLAGTESIAEWKKRPLREYRSVKLVPCAHAEEEARVIALLLREALESPGTRAALVTPDEGLMERVAAHLKRYHVVADRLTKGTLAGTDAGSVWLLLLAAMREPERLLHVRSLLHHPLVGIEPEFLRAMEPYWYGVAPRRYGQLPRLPDAVRMQPACEMLERLVKLLARQSRARTSAPEWIETGQALLSMLSLRDGQAQEAVEEIFMQLNGAALLGPMELREFASLLEESLHKSVRHGGIATHPHLVMLTPIEARLEQFDRVILASMTDTVWPGMPTANAWLNLAAQEALGLPSPAARASLMAHDVMMLGSAREVFCTWALREKGSPTQRSRYLERLATYLAMHGIEERAITANEYGHWARAMNAAVQFMPHAPVLPRPAIEQRPRALPVSALDTLFSDPFAVYARYILRLKALNTIDAEPEASDFGNLAHKAIEALTRYWNTHVHAPDDAALQAMAEKALRDFSEQPGAALFWRTRLLRALAFVNAQEAGRREAALLIVTPEQEIARSLTLSEGLSLELSGCIDRVETAEDGVTLADYKTGEIPSEKRILDGRATQLLTYAMLWGEEVGALEYWRLPHGRHEGQVLALGMEQLVAAELPARLREGLRSMFDPDTPFLANPNQFGHAYDGISRYDEWAG